MVHVVPDTSRFPLDVEAAQRFLACVPLLSLEEAPPRFFGSDAVLLARGNSGSSTAEASLRQGCGETPDRGKAGDARGGFSLDVRRAERFLKSLEVQIGSKETVDEGLFWGVARKPGSRGPGGGVWPEGGHPSKGADSHENMHTVIGGWRNRADLDRLTPGLIKKGLIGGRVIITAQESATYVCSTRPWSKDATGGAFERQDVLQVFAFNDRDGAATPRCTSAGLCGGLLSRWRKRLLSTLPPWARHWSCCRSRRRGPGKTPSTSFSSYLEPSNGDNYDPGFLDDQSLRQGKHHTVLQLESYQVSVIPFIRPRRLKEELNDQFRCSHPNIHPSITLSKLRNLQKDLREITVMVPELDASTVAMAWVYFEKLVLGDHVRKGNRKLLAGACLVLAFKFHQHEGRAVMRQLAACIRKLDRKDQLGLEALRDAELQVFVWLKFGLHLRRDAVMPHLLRLLKDMGTNLEEYYGPDGPGCRGLLDDKCEIEGMMNTNPFSALPLHFNTSSVFGP